MKQEDKDLLLKDLCARLLYRPKGLKIYKDGICLPDNITIIGFSGRFVDVLEAIGQVEVEKVRLYLRPMSSMTEEEKEDYNSKFEGRDFSWEIYYGSTDWLNAHHFDYRGLIEKGLALEASKDIYK